MKHRRKKLKENFCDTDANDGQQQPRPKGREGGRKGKRMEGKKNKEVEEGRETNERREREREQRKREKRLLVCVRVWADGVR